MIIGETVKTLRENKGLSQAGLARIAGISNDYMNKIELGKVSNVGLDIVSAIAKALGVRPTHLISDEKEEPSSSNAVLKPPGAKEPPIFEKEKIPVIGLAKAGKEGFFDDAGYPVGEGFRKVDKPDFVTDQNAYALEIDGDSMSPALEKGWTIVASPEKQVMSGDLVVARLQSGEVMLKKVKFQDGLIVLTSVNPTYEPIALKKKDLVLLHKVVLMYPK